MPPAVSAIKKDGVRSYERARKGDAEPLAPRVVAVHGIELLDGGIDADGHGGWLALTCHVAKGYYVRSLARDLAATLGMMSEEHAEEIQALAVRLNAMLWRLQH